MSDFTPTELPEADQRAALESRIRQLEGERLIAGLELEGTKAIPEAAGREQAIAQDTANFQYAVDTLDAKLKVYRDALAALPA